jgi:hypothetical protein
MAFGLSLELYYLSSADCSAPLLRFAFPYSAKQCEYTYPGFTSPSTVHLQAFSTSWWFTPHIILKPCCMLLALMGFSLQSIPLKSSIAPSSSLITLHVWYRFSNCYCRLRNSRIAGSHKPGSSCEPSDTIHLRL